MGGWFRMAAVAALMPAAAGAASAQPFPSRPVHIFVPYPAVDVLTRTLGDVVAKRLTVQVHGRCVPDPCLAYPAKLYGFPN